jgi:hypothetical protein
MAMKMLIVCDLEDSKERDGEPVSFGVGGTVWTIDLCAKHRTKLDKDLEPFREHARKVRNGTVRTSSASKNPTGRAAEIRRWAAASGIEVSPNGRIAAAVEAKYDAEQNGSGR